MTSGSTVRLTVICQACHTNNTLAVQALDDSHVVCCSHCGHPLGRLGDLVRPRLSQQESPAA